MSSIVPRSSFLASLKADRATGTALATIQTGAFLERAEDEARLALETAKMSDAGIATHHAFDEGERIVRDFQNRVGDDPFVARALAPYLEEGLRGVHRPLRRLTEDR